MGRSVKLPPEDHLALLLKEANIHHKRQVKCIPGRRFAFDFLCDATYLTEVMITSTPRPPVLVEVQGGVHMKRGGHSTGTGITRDAEKASLAAVYGYRLIVATTEHVRDGRALMWIKQALGLLPA